MEEHKIRHLEMIQGVINRMAHCSFLLKGWTVVLVSGMFALSSRDTNNKFAVLALLPALIFWFLDGYFILQERLYRALYDFVRKTNDSEIDFSMNAKRFLGDDRTWLNSIISKTLSMYYGVVIVAILLMMFFA